MFVRRASRGLMRAAASASSAPAAPGITGPRATLAGSGFVDAHTVPPHLRSRRLGLRRGDAVVTAVAGARGYNGGVNGGDRGGDGAPRPPARPAQVEFLGEETAPAAPAGNAPGGRPGGRGKRSTSTGKRPGASSGTTAYTSAPPPPARVADVHRRTPPSRQTPGPGPGPGRGKGGNPSAAAHLPRPPWVAAHLPRPPRGSSPPRENHPPSRRRPINTDNSSRDTCPKRLRLRPFLRLSRRRRRRPVVRPSPTVPPSRSATC